MPYSCSLDQLTLVIDAVNDSVRSDNYFTYGWETILGDDLAKLGKVLQLVSLCD